MQNALAAGDAMQLRKEAHALRGAAANMSASIIAGLAGQIETAAVKGDLSSVSPVMDQLYIELERLQQNLLMLGKVESVDQAERNKPCAF
jgi:HPt (histidine-containing phosphotransfer) domain-containing protein